MDVSAPTETSLGYCRIYFLGKKLNTIDKSRFAQKVPQMKKCGEILDLGANLELVFHNAGYKKLGPSSFPKLFQNKNRRGDETIKGHWKRVKCADSKMSQ